MGAGPMLYRRFKSALCAVLTCLALILVGLPDGGASKKNNKKRRGMWAKPNRSKTRPSGSDPSGKQSLPQSGKTTGGGRKIRRSKSQGKNGKISPKDYVRSDAYTLALKNLPDHADLSGGYASQLTTLGKRYACLVKPTSIRRASLTETAAAMIEAYEQELALLHEYQEVLIDALNDAGEPRPVANLTGMPREPTRNMDAELTVVEALKVGKKDPALARDGLVSALVVRLAEAPHHRGRLGEFVDLVGDADGRMLGLRAKTADWLKRAKRLRGSSPLDPVAVRELTAEGQRVIDEVRDQLVALPSDEGDDQGVVSTADGDPEGHDRRQVIESSEEESRALRRTILQTCDEVSEEINEDLGAIAEWMRILRELSGLVASHFIVTGGGSGVGPDSSAVPLLQTRFGEFASVSKGGNRGKYRGQSAAVFGQRLIRDLMVQIERSDELYGRNDAEEIRGRAVEVRWEAGVHDLPEALTVADILRDPAKVNLALGIDSRKPLHGANKASRYSIKRASYNSLHELLAWRGVELLETLARGTPTGDKGAPQEDLGWTFSLGDAGTGGAEGYWTKIPRAWDAKRLLAQQGRLGGGKAFWKRFWGDPPVENEGRVVARAAQLATLQLLVERRFVERLSAEQRAEVGAKQRDWVDAGGIRLTDILGLPEVSPETLVATVEAPDGNGADPAAVRVLEDGRRFAEQVTAWFRELKKQPTPWFEPFAPLVKAARLDVAFDRRQGLMVLQPREGG